MFTTTVYADNNTAATVAVILGKLKWIILFYILFIISFRRRGFIFQFWYNTPLPSSAMLLLLLIVMVATLTEEEEGLFMVDCCLLFSY